jgi:hypothetical protein
MTPDSADGIRDTLAMIDRGEIEATDAQRAYLAGALHGLTGEPEQNEL